MAIEDLHWIDKTSEEFLDYLIGWITNSRFLLILLYRPEYTHPWGSKSYYNRIGLDQLTTKSSAELVEAILTGELPPKGSIIGVNPKTVCDECDRSTLRLQSPGGGDGVLEVDLVVQRDGDQDPVEHFYLFLGLAHERLRSRRG